MYAYADMCTYTHPHFLRTRASHLRKCAPVYICTYIHIYVCICMYVLMGFKHAQQASGEGDFFEQNQIYETCVHVYIYVY